MMRLTPGGVGALLALGLAATAAFGFATGGQPEAALLLYTGEQQGYLEPCGCTKPQIGGLPRRAAYFASLQTTEARRQTPAPEVASGAWPLAPIIVDNGDMVADPGRQSQLKAEALAGFYREAGYAAVNLGECDYQLGFGYLRSLQASAGVPFLSANVRLGERPAFHETTTAGGTTLVGVLAASFSAEVRRWNPMLRVESPEATLERLEPTLKPAGRVVLLFHGTPDEARPLARQFSWLAAIVTAHEADDYRAEPLMEAGVPMVNAGRKGKVVGRLELAADRVKALAPVPMGPEWKDAPSARAVLNRYLARVNGEELLQQVPRLPDPEGREFAGSATCRGCHSDAHAVWEKSAHAHAFQTLVKAGHDRDPDCVGCHVVGLGTKGGFESEAATPQLKDVGCESCHGGAAAHARSAGAQKVPRVGTASCATCHVAEHSPNFRFAEYWAKIRH